jgi:sugar phosphate isomerase/epimerase
MSLILATIALEPNRWTRYHEPASDVIELLPLIREAGFDQLEVWQWHLTTRCLAAVRDLKARGDELGISFPYIAAYPSFIAEGLEAREQEGVQADVLDKAAVLGTRCLKIMLGAGARGGDLTSAQLELTAQRFGRWYREAKARGIAMCAELHGGTLFDPIEAGEAFMREHPELDFSICYQPIDFNDLGDSLELAQRFAGRITHIHLQAPQGDGGYALLEEGQLDLRRLLPPILEENPNATMTLEFVKECIQPDRPFDPAPALANARRDAEYVEAVIANR